MVRTAATWPLPALDPAVQGWLVGLADLVTRARSPVIRERGGGALQGAPEPEVPACFALQLHALAQGLVLVAGGTEVTPADRRRLAPLLDILQRLRKVPQLAGTRATHPVMDQQEAAPERPSMRVRQEYAEALHAGRAVTRPADAAERQSSV